tara:strand:+ start:798 stop:971 length:174 start_codon:yes stop_codon:yes gene_type:complete
LALKTGVINHQKNKKMKHDKKVKPHKMYCKDGSVHDVKTYKEHKALMKKGCGHKKPK